MRQAQMTRAMGFDYKKPGGAPLSHGHLFQNRYKSFCVLIFFLSFGIRKMMLMIYAVSV